MRDESIVVRGFPRLAVCLMDLSRDGFRRYGSAGFCITGPTVEVRAGPAAAPNVSGWEQLDERGRHDILATLDRMSRAHRFEPVALTILRCPPQHQGLGSKTALLLSILRATQLARGLQIADHELQWLSGRGGTSGIGVNTFFVGGFLTDGGHDPARSPGFWPSSSQHPAEVPLVVARHDIPENWRFHLIRCDGLGYSGEQEVRFFREQAPIPRVEVDATIAAVYHGVVPAIQTRNLDLLKRALAAIHSTGWKYRCLSVQKAGLRGMLQRLAQVPDCAAGMSSFGPIVYVIAERDDTHLVQILLQLCEELGAEFLGSFEGRNRGHEVVDGLAS